MDKVLSVKPYSMVEEIKKCFCILLQWKFLNNEKQKNLSFEKSSQVLRSNSNTGLL